ncbi:hypothetical protein [Sporolituus thermophilus]|uniref:Uncharacterized protein n=1 Tax=Sporolituus thermophilus DSM 23256 TaxID=1123285 RepID=A0A1G7KYR8_9FIRM|nr:hypothetical protein [Sporolituus thermophilus]SDF42412.1 hypothetical protein SAMN05660235_01533 [Sporolituus thermophilus DSM 23256]
MGRFIVSLLIIMVLLTAAGYLYRLTPYTYTDEDNAFADESAGAMLALMERIAREGAALQARSPGRAADIYWEGQYEFNRLKHAALFYKGALAEDFVYALDLAEAWCKYAADAADNPADAKARRLAEQRFAAARAEFRAIIDKEYR